MAVAGHTAPDRFGRYDVIKVLGQGVFGTVFLAEDSELKRMVAVKVPKVDQLSCPQDVERYMAEARIVASLDHLSIVPVYDVGQTDDGILLRGVEIHRGERFAAVDHRPLGFAPAGGGVGGRDCRRAPFCTPPPLGPP